MLSRMLDVSSFHKLRDTSAAAESDRTAQSGTAQKNFVDYEAGELPAEA